MDMLGLDTELTENHAQKVEEPSEVSLSIRNIPWFVHWSSPIRPSTGPTKRGHNSDLV